MKLKNDLKSIIKKIKKTNREIAKEMSVDPTAVSYWANNKMNIHENHHQKLSKILETPEDKIFFAEDTQGQKYKLTKINK